MARAASRKSSSKRVSSHRKCVATTARRMHKIATRPHSHQLALARANKTTSKSRSRKNSGTRPRRMIVMNAVDLTKDFDRMRRKMNEKFEKERKKNYKKAEKQLIKNQKKAEKEARKASKKSVANS